MSIVLDLRNPSDLITTFDKLEIQRNTSNSSVGMTTINGGTTSINSATASDLGTGYTTYIDPDGIEGTHYYRFRYKNSVTSAVSAWSDIFRAGQSVMHTKFRRAMRDTNSNNYFFTDEDIDGFLSDAVARLWPITWFETFDDVAFVPNGTTINFPFPNGVTRVNSVRAIDTYGNDVGSFGKYSTRGRYLIFDTAPRTGSILRAFVEKMFTRFSEVPEVWDSHILNLMKLFAFQTMEADRTNFYKYNAVAKPEGGNLPSIDRIINRLELQISRRENQLRRVRRPATIRLA